MTILKWEKLPEAHVENIFQHILHERKINGSVPRRRISFSYCRCACQSVPALISENLNKQTRSVSFYTELQAKRMMMTQVRLIPLVFLYHVWKLLRVILYNKKSIYYCFFHLDDTLGLIVQEQFESDNKVEAVDVDDDAMLLLLIFICSEESGGDQRTMYHS